MLRRIYSKLRAGIRSLSNSLSKSDCNSYNRNYEFIEIGFHGDNYLLDVVQTIAADCSYFIETGANVGSTLAYVSSTYPRLECLSCEPDEDAFSQALRNTAGQLNVKVFNETSQAFFWRIGKEYQKIFSENVLIWLDAHGYGFQWPLKDELSFITNNFKSAYILIDDFKVPGLDCFGYDVDRGQECSFEYTQDSLNPTLHYNLHYPAYTERTSEHHPLQGWGLIEYGHATLRFPDSLQGKISSFCQIQAGRRK